MGEIGIKMITDTWEIDNPAIEKNVDNEKRQART